MFDGQFFPGQRVQFESSQPLRNPWHQNDAFEIATRLGLTTNLKLCLDAGDSSSYTSGQKWLDLSGNGYDFFVGADGSATATDPTFNGVAGSLSSAEYFSLDGGDYFRYDTTNETWMQNLHKDNAVFTFVAWAYLGSLGATQALCGTRGGSATNIGVRWQVSATNAMQIAVANGSADTLAQTAGSSLNPSATTWTMMGVSLNEATGAGGVLWYRDGLTDTDTSTYAAPTASNATNTLEIGGSGGGANLLTSGSRLGMLLAWEGTALTAANFDAIFRATRGRFGV